MSVLQGYLQDRGRWTPEVAAHVGACELTSIEDLAFLLETEEERAAVHPSVPLAWTEAVKGSFNTRHLAREVTRLELLAGSKGSQGLWTLEVRQAQAACAAEEFHPGRSWAEASSAGSGRS